MDKENKIWYVVYTRPRWEKKVAARLEVSGTVYYCPLQKVLRQWSDRKKIVEEPLFKGYVFVSLEPARKWDIRNVNGVLNFVHWLGKPAEVKNEEIDTIRKFMDEFDEVEVVLTDVALNDTVRVKKGLLMNYAGIVLNVQGGQATVKIEQLGIQLSAKFERSNLEKL